MLLLYKTTIMCVMVVVQFSATINIIQNNKEDSFNYVLSEYIRDIPTLIIVNVMNVAFHLLDSSWPFSSHSSYILKGIVV